MPKFSVGRWVKKGLQKIQKTEDKLYSTQSQSESRPPTPSQRKQSNPTTHDHEHDSTKEVRRASSSGTQNASDNDKAVAPGPSQGLTNPTSAPQPEPAGLRQPPYPIAGDVPPMLPNPGLLGGKETTPGEEKPRKVKLRTQKATWVVAVQNALVAVERASDVFPPLKSTIAGINALLDLKDAFTSNQEEFEKLSERVRFLDEILRGRPKADLPQEIADRLEGLKRSIEAMGQTLEDKTHRNGLTRAAYTKDDQQDILRLVREITFAIELAMLDVAIHNNVLICKAVTGINWLRERMIEEHTKLDESLSEITTGVAVLNKAELFKRLGDTKNHAYTRGGRRKGCVAGSRISLLSQLLAWAENRTSGHAFWLSGIAGAGKTAVSETFCLELSNRGMLGASFFCSVTSQDLSDVYAIIPSLAKELAQSCARFGEALATVLISELGSDKSPLSLTLQEQYDFLLVRPASLAFHGHQGTIVLCVDALDECSDSGALKEFLDAIVLTKAPWPLKIFLTSRPEVAITERMESPSYAAHQTPFLRLQDIEDHIVQGDIELYVNRMLDRIPVLRSHYGSNWPPPEVQKIVERCGTLFIVAATIVRYIDDDRGNRISRFLSCGSPDAPMQSGVETLYRNILEKTFSDLSSEEEEDLRACLFLLVAALKPLTVGEYAGLLDRPAWVIQEAFKSLYSVVEVHDVRGVSIHHASFINFLTGSYLPMSRKPKVATRDFPWAVNVTHAHAMAAERCLALLQSDDHDKGVYFGVSGATTSYRSNHGQQLKSRSDLAYACAMWGDHALRARPLSSGLEQTIQAFLDTKGLFWIEALGAEKRVGTRSTSVLWDLSRLTRNDYLKELLVDIRDFCQTLGTPINHSAPHLYLSALPFVKATMKPFKRWKLPEFPSIPIIDSVGSRNNRFSKILIHSVNVQCLDVSDDGTRVLTGSSDGEVQVWNIFSGELALDPLEGHLEAVTSVAFSPGGSTIASGSEDATIRIWHALTGQPSMNPMEGHTMGITSIAFSPDGKRLVSGSKDRTIRIWDAKTGECTLIMKGHEDWVKSVAFSPDGTTVASGSDDSSIRLWDAETGAPKMEPLYGHKDWVLSIAFSPDGESIVSGSKDNTIGLWSLPSRHGKILLSGRHSDWVSSVAFSLDGTTVVSGSHDGALRWWDAKTGELKMKTIEGHRDRVVAIRFSHDGLSLISGSSDETIRAWNTQSWNLGENTSMEGHTDVVQSVAFSPDGSRIVSGSADMTVRIWDARSGKPAISPLKGHEGVVTSVAFSPDGRKIASGSSDKTIRVWDSQTGNPTQRSPFKGHTRSVNSIDFSPTGQHIISGSTDVSTRVWDAETGSQLHRLRVGRGGRAGRHRGTLDTSANPYNNSRDFSKSPAHTRSITSVAWSPDNLKIASGSEDSTVRVWESIEQNPPIQTRFADPENTGTNEFYAVAFSPDSTLLAAGSMDSNVTVWEVQNPMIPIAVLRGHKGPVASVAFSLDGSRIASGSHDGTIIIWDTKSWKSAEDPFRGHTETVTSVAFSPDGSKVVSGSRDTTIRVWNVDRGSQTASLLPIFLHHYPRHSVVLRDDGWVCSGSHDDLLLWIPPQLRSFLHIQPLDFIIGGDLIDVNLTGAVYHGTNWLRCNQPHKNDHQELSSYGEPWPMGSNVGAWRGSVSSSSGSHAIDTENSI